MTGESFLNRRGNQPVRKTARKKSKRPIGWNRWAFLLIMLSMEVVEVVGVPSRNCRRRYSFRHRRWSRVVSWWTLCHRPHRRSPTIRAAAKPLRIPATIFASQGLPLTRPFDSLRCPFRTERSLRIPNSTRQTPRQFKVACFSNR